MPITTLDTNTALIVIDLQKGIVSLPGLPPLDAIIDHAASLAAAFRAHGLPVVLVNVAGVAPGRAEQSMNTRDLPAGWTDLIPALNRQPGDHLITKHTWGAFTNTGLDALLKRHGVTQVVLAGVATSAGVESTARFAHEAGYNVTLATDAMTDRNPDAHANCLQHVFPRLGETGTTQDILSKLVTRGASA